MRTEEILQALQIITTENVRFEAEEIEDGIVVKTFYKDDVYLLSFLSDLELETLSARNLIKYIIEGIDMMDTATRQQELLNLFNED